MSVAWYTSAKMMVNVSEAQVAKILCSGLKRANGDLLLKATIEAGSLTNKTEA